MSRLLYTIVFFCVFVSSFAQITHIQEKYSLKVLKTTESIRIDAEETDAVWQKAQPIGDFWQQFPSSDKKTRTRTTVKAAFDNQFLYFLIEAYDSTNQYVAPNLKRDQGMEEQDGITVILDPVNKKTNGFGFSCTPNNVQSEFQFTPSFEKFNYSWDNKWFSAAKRYADKYVIEMAIPFKTLRFSSENTSWGVNFIRSNRKNNELSTWTNVPVQFQAIDLGYLGLLSFEEKLIQQKGNISLIPYLRSSSISESGSTAGYKINAGLDTKIAVTSSLNLDIAINPDFSQVDVDQQVTNLTRFSILFPERRTFFLENADLFTDFGAKPLRPFFSRRIGLNANAEPIPILLGVRLTGNLTEKTRIGVMNVQTGKAGDSSPKNYTATAIHQRIGSRSVIKGYFHNEESIGSTSETKSQASSAPDSRFGRNAGVELNLNNQSGTHRFWAAAHTSIKDGLKGNNNFYQIGMGYFGRKFNGLIDFDRFENNYRADMGFINRLETFAKTGPSYNHADTTIRAGFYQIYNENNFTIRPKDKSLVLLILGQSNYATWFNDGRFSDRRNTVYADFKFRNTINALFLLNMQEDNLRYYFPLPQNKPLSPGNYRYNNLEIQFKGDSRKNVILNGSLTFGDYYNAKIRRYSMNLLIRKQPFINTTLSAEFNDLLFPEEYGRTKLLLAGPKIEATFTNKLFWTTFLQFNTQQNNFNINSRLQFRYSPMSDFFLVYSDNYYTTNLMNKNRAIIFKWNYWLTL
jgi:hypothetical protein